jgi:Zn ribbon nucleic-acid-binding protein
MASPTRKTREELIASGHCPNCSKCAAFLFQMERSATVYQCRGCGTLLLEVYRPEDKPDLRSPKDRQQCFDAGGNPIPYNEERLVFDVTGYWDEIRDWFFPRRDETDAKQAELADRFEAEKYDFERGLRAELCQMIPVLLGKTVVEKTTEPPTKSETRHGLTLVKGV